MRPNPARLIEREVPEALLDEVLEAARSGQGGCVFLVGEAGLGKTALLDAARRSWQVDGQQVGHAVASPMEVDVPFGLLDRALSALGGTDTIGEVTNVDRAEPSSSRRYRTMRWLEKACAAEPVFLALDDLHWSDPDSLALLGYLCRRIGRLPTAIVGTLRPEPDRAHHVVDDLVATAAARVALLAPLSRLASSELASRILERAVTDEESEAIWRGAAGTPLLIEAAAEALRHGSPPGEVEGRVAVRRRFGVERFVGLGSDALSYATAAAIFGVRFRRSLVARLAGLDELRAAGVHGQLVRARLLEDADSTWSHFRHPLFAESLLDGVGGARRQALHAFAFRLLVEAGSPDGESAQHAYAGLLLGDPLAIEVASRAGRTAAALGAFEVAATHLAQAVELAGGEAPPSLRLAHASVLVALARPDEARARCEELLADDRLGSAARASALRLLGQGAFVASRYTEAQRFFEEAASAAADDPVEQGRGLLDAVLTSLATAKMSWSEAAARRALGLLPASAPEHRVCELVRAYVQLLCGDPAGADVIESAIDAWRADASPTDPARSWAVAFMLHGATKALERYADSARIFAAEYERARRDGSPLTMATMAISQADALHRLGRTEEALGIVDDYYTHGHYAVYPWVDLAKAALLTELDRTPEATAHVARLREFVAATPRGFVATVALWTDVLEARALLEDGRAGEASDAMVDAQAVSEEAGLLHPLVVPWWPVGVDAHLRAGRIDLAASLLDHLAPIAERLALRWPTAVVTLGRARLAATLGEHVVADGLFEAAVDLHRAAEMPISCAEALVAYGSHLRRSRRPLAAREPLREAAALAARSGSPRVARQALAELAAAGGRRPRPRRSPGELTAREIQVAELVAEGRSNAEIASALFVSVKTVEHHLGCVYRKLGITSRRALIGRRFSDLTLDLT